MRLHSVFVSQMSFAYHRLSLSVALPLTNYLSLSKLNMSSHLLLSQRLSILVIKNCCLSGGGGARL